MVDFRIPHRIQQLRWIAILGLGSFALASLIIINIAGLNIGRPGIDDSGGHGGELIVKWQHWSILEFQIGYPAEPELPSLKYRWFANAACASPTATIGTEVSPECLSLKIGQDFNISAYLLEINRRYLQYSWFYTSENVSDPSANTTYLDSQVDLDYLRSNVGPISVAASALLYTFGIIAGLVPVTMWIFRCCHMDDRLGNIRRTIILCCLGTAIIFLVAAQGYLTSHGTSLARDLRHAMKTEGGKESVRMDMVFQRRGWSAIVIFSGLFGLVLWPNPPVAREPSIV